GVPGCGRVQRCSMFLSVVLWRFVRRDPWTRSDVPSRTQNPPENTAKSTGLAPSLDGHLRTLDGQVFHAGRRQLEDEHACGLAAVIAEGGAASGRNVERRVLEQDGVHLPHGRGHRSARDEPHLFTTGGIARAITPRRQEKERAVEAGVVDHRLGEQPGLFRCAGELLGNHSHRSLRVEVKQPGRRARRRWELTSFESRYRGDRPSAAEASPRHACWRTGAAFVITVRATRVKPGSGWGAMPGKRSG